MNEHLLNKAELDDFFKVGLVLLLTPFFAQPRFTFPLIFFFTCSLNSVYCFCSKIPSPLMMFTVSLGTFFSPYAAGVIEKRKKINWTNIRDNFWVLSSVPLIYMSIFLPVSHYLDYCSFVLSFETST